MSRVSYFQRFSQRENHATNNTLLILRAFYESSPFKIQRVLSSLIDEDCSIGLTFTQQVTGQSSTPDALISQDALKIFVETKRGGKLDVDQMERHIQSIAVNADAPRQNALIGLTKEPIAIDEAEQLKKTAKARGVFFAAVTFSQVVDALHEECKDHERELSAMVEDFEQFLAEESLLDERNQLMPVVPCGTSYDENKRFNLYYEPAARRCKRNYRFLGLYAQKTVSLVGVIEAIGIATHQNGQLSVQKEFGEISELHKERIKQAIAATDYYSLKAETVRFYLVDQFVQTNLRKSSSGGLWGLRYLDLSKIIPDYDARKTYTAEELARELSDKSFE